MILIKNPCELVWIFPARVLQGQDNMFACVCVCVCVCTFLHGWGSVCVSDCCVCGLQVCVCVCVVHGCDCMSMRFHVGV